MKTTNTDSMSYKSKWKTALAAATFLGIIIAFFFMCQFLLVTSTILVNTPEDVENIDFSTEIALLHNNAYDWYGGKLYTPEDFAAGVPVPEKSDSRYGTNRLVLRLPTGKIYGISGTSASYAQKVWVNGVLLSEVGRVSDTPEGFFPKTTIYSVYFTADSPQTEIVIQRAHHNHVRGYYVKLYLGDAQVIAQMDKATFLHEGLITGALISIAIFFFGMFLFYSNRYSFLWFALACFFTALQDAIYNKSIMAIFPDLNWYLGHKIEYISLIAYFFFMFLFAFSMLDWKVNKWLRRAGCVFFTGSIAVYAIFPSTIYTHYTKTMRELLTVYIAVGAIGLAVTAIRHKELRKPDHLLVVTSMMMMAVAWWIEQRGYMGDMVIAVPLTTLIVAFIGAISLAIGFARTERQLDLARQNEREMEENNRLLERLNSVKSDFLSSLSHEMRTPLTIMGGYAGATMRQIKKNAVDAGTLQNLDTIQQEALRLGRLVEQLKAVSLEKERQLTLTDTDAGTLLKKVAAFCGPIYRKNGNRITVEAGPEPIPLRVNTDHIFQVLFNLITNANNHTQGGRIVLSAVAEESAVRFEVRDDGSGIDPALLDSVFERGVSGSGGTGLGLAICKEIVEEYGGRIVLLSSEGKGTTVRFTLPYTEEDEPA